MTRTTPRLTIAALALSLAAASTAHAVTMSTAPLHPDVDGRLVCTVTNVSGRALGIQAQIVNDVGLNVTDFIATKWMSENEGVLSEVVAESSDNTARYCRITVSGGGRGRVRATLEARDADGTLTALVEAR